MDKIIDLYGDSLLYVFDKEKINIDKEYLIIIKSDSEIKDIDNCLVMHYCDDFEQYLRFKLPTKMRKEKKLLSLKECQEMFSDIKYGVLSFSDEDYPYSVALNHVIFNNRIFFHCSMEGYKLNGINKNVNYVVIDDLGINLEVGTHNHKELVAYGKLVRIDDKDLKRDVLLKLVHDLAPKHPYHDRMLEYTNILELKIDYIAGKIHFY